jgi:hypothetical protein
MDCIGFGLLGHRDANDMLTSLVLTSYDYVVLYGESATTYADE